MGFYQPKPYKAFRDGKWITVTPQPVNAVKEKTNMVGSPLRAKSVLKYYIEKE